MHKIMIGNFKGGTGKTVSSVSIAHALILKGKRILLIDADPQGNSSNWIEPKGIEYELADIISGKISIDQAIITTKQGFDMIITFPDGDLRRIAESQLIQKPYAIADMLETLGNKYDFIIVDTSPAFSPLERSIALAVDEVIVPVELEFFAVDGLGQFDKNIQELNKNWRSKIKINMILLTKYNKSFSRHNILLKRITQNQGYNFYTIRQDAIIAESIGLNQTIYDRDSQAKSAVDYMNVAVGL